MREERHGHEVAARFADGAGGSLLRSPGNWLIFCVLHWYENTGALARDPKPHQKASSSNSPIRNTQEREQSRYATSTHDHDHNHHRQEMYQSNSPAKFSSAFQYHSHEKYSGVLYWTVLLSSVQLLSRQFKQYKSMSHSNIIDLFLVKLYSLHYIYFV